MIDPGTRRRRAQKWKRWERGTPMELWQLDVVGGFLLGDGHQRAPPQEARGRHPPAVLKFRNGASMAHGFDVVRLPEILSFTVVTNTRSRGVMERIGMHLAGEFDHPRAYPDAHWKRHALYRMNPTDRARDEPTGVADRAPPLRRPHRTADTEQSLGR